MRWPFFRLLAPALVVTGCGGSVSAPPTEAPTSCDHPVVAHAQMRRPHALDLLLVIDNSASMADKQRALARALPGWVHSLTAPDPDPTTGAPRPVRLDDVHVGVITSSLGSHGTDACDLAKNGHQDDRGHLLPRAGEGAGTGWTVDHDGATPTAVACPTPLAATALSWVYDPSVGDATFVGAASSPSLQAAAGCVVQSAGEDGCGYEETWEALYHFLIDPAPYASAKVTMCPPGALCGSTKIELSGVDDELLRERAAFLRKDSLVSIVVVSDENDVSLEPVQLNWIPWQYAKGQMQRGWKACEAVPDDFEPNGVDDFARLHDVYGCWSCFERTDDPGGNCGVPWATDAIDHDVDGRNLRGFHQVQRYGYEFLWSRQRYVDGLTKSVVPGLDATGTPTSVTNPLFDGGFRVPDMVTVTALVGVPPALVTAADGAPKALAEPDWDRLIAVDLGKRDPHMIESIAPRAGLPRFAGDRAVDPVHGGERDVLDGDDLQYACIVARDTDVATADCADPRTAKGNPLCAPLGKQPFAKAYPGLRHLRIVHDLGASGVVGSLCTPDLNKTLRRSAKAPSLDALCVKPPLRSDAAGRVDCAVFELLEGSVGRCEDLGPDVCTPGAAPCRAEPVAIERAAAGLAVPLVDIEGHVVPAPAYVANGNVYARGRGGVPRLLCEQRPLAGPGRDPALAVACATDPGFGLPAGVGGWCYATDLDVVGDACRKAGGAGKLRLLGQAQPRNGSDVFATCSAIAAPAATCP